MCILYFAYSLPGSNFQLIWLKTQNGSFLFGIIVCEQCEWIVVSKRLFDSVSNGKWKGCRLWWRKLISIGDSGFYQESWLLWKNFCGAFQAIRMNHRVAPRAVCFWHIQGDQSWARNLLSKSRSWKNGAKVKISVMIGNDLQCWRNWIEDLWHLSHLWSLLAEKLTRFLENWRQIELLT